MVGRIVRIALVLLGVCGALLAADLPGVWLDVPFVKQEKDGCGAASIKRDSAHLQFAESGKTSSNIWTRDVR